MCLSTCGFQAGKTTKHRDQPRITSLSPLLMDLIIEFFYLSLSLWVMHNLFRFTASVFSTNNRVNIFWPLTTLIWLMFSLAEGDLLSLAVFSFSFLAAFAIYSPMMPRISSWNYSSMFPSTNSMMCSLVVSW